MSVIMRDAARLWGEMRADFDLYMLAQMDQAARDCRGVLLSARGREAHVRAESLFTGPWGRVLAYGSEELVSWFREHGRMTVEDYEAQWWEGRAIR